MFCCVIKFCVMKTLELDFRAYKILAGISRILGHKLRSPLSVVSNDLSYFQTLLPESECDRSLEKCRNISGMLREIVPPQIKKEEFIVFDLRLLLKSLASDNPGISINGNSSERIPVRGNREALRLAFQSILNLVLWNQQNGNSSKALIDMDSSANSRCISFSGTFENPAFTKDPADFSSMTDLICFHINLDSLEAPLADALLWAHGVETELHYNIEDSLLKIQLTFPEI